MSEEDNKMDYGNTRISFEIIIAKQQERIKELEVEIEGQKEIIARGFNEAAETLLKRLQGENKRLRDELRRLQAVVGEEDYELIEQALKGE